METTRSICRPEATGGWVANVFEKYAPKPGQVKQVDGEFELGVESVGCLAGNDYGGKNKAKKSTYQEADHQGDHRFPLSSRLRLNQCFEEDRNVLYGITVPLMGFKGI